MVNIQIQNKHTKKNFRRVYRQSQQFEKNIYRTDDNNTSEFV